jgi:transposase
MLGERSAQRGLFEADTLFADFVGRRNFYGFLASQRDELFRDEDFAALYCCNNGRPSVPPSLLANALVLQAYDGVSDDEAKQRADYDLRWKVALGIELDVRPFAKSTLQEFRAQLIVHDQTRAIFERIWRWPSGAGVEKRIVWFNLLEPLQLTGSIKRNC